MSIDDQSLRFSLFVQDLRSIIQSKHSQTPKFIKKAIAFEEVAASSYRPGSSSEERG
jgi:hypothetical protein